MTAHTLEKDVVVKRINGIQKECAALVRLGTTPFDVFNDEDGTAFQLAQYHLHRALEGVFHISAHILSRIPGGQATQYREMARKMGEYGIVDKAFAGTKLVDMARYRNRLVHFYAEITPPELYGILQDDLGDFETFLHAVKRVLEHPEQFGLAVE
ncbi:MAG: hypothetical protein A3J10_02440 [Candidatus Sungbacteria bacterium RIFCSPLOWO2_02_FULL_54_10]|uniref:DUF86 domain-containing protein n=2 Tax=Candidatus Sungiibacteriota TaxID=1817917 RepID=A0A1G2L4E0_9BACT|nr:MAG: hypothetical protein A2679_02305 [Candidatus Sungbacteria bacterium RIFCSPHIGHO2_01_FULL_54_26]OHA03215.1 MAG: hypothetical protein A3C92_01750 [Candidatus Sungbacteria bacterium RIFCSPHIGHO2_02_FULL_53_17]OHA06566.1 MAG: hypothetical protein A3B34_01500 [Candidatus Sungbacteria bacterium RIFCSPLOWO2_01_FULL_54_21]OHA13792.1 MAG: hypothetical protein A3J10_02440 [Candidatus Sungbacteria bacterium RIFCSPLOWO2_02_FULL_54_10]